MSIASRGWKSLFVAGTLFCLGAHAAEKQSLDDIAEALWQEPNSVSIREMLAVLSESAGENVSTRFATVFCETCRRADAETLADLVRIFDAFPPEAYEKEVLFTALADAWLRIRISPRLSQRPVFPKAPTKLTAAPEDYPRELREAALEYERVRAPFLALQKGNTNFQTNKRTYWNLVSRLLEQEDGPWTEGFCAYRWGGLCGTGEESFVVPQSRVLLMALAADQRWTEAAGAAMEVTPSAVPESLINTIASMVCHAHRTGRKEAYNFLKRFVLEQMHVPDWPHYPMNDLRKMTPPPLPPTSGN
jgi:hypothetical protein